MKVAIAAQGDSLQSPMDPRFGRCAYFVIVDTDTMQYEAIENSAAQQGSGAGIAAAQLVADQGVEAVVAGNFGPNSTQVLQAAGIRMLQAAGMTVAQAAAAAAANQLVELSSASVGPKAGMAGGDPTPSPGGGRGAGRGMGWGPGMGAQATPGYWGGPGGWPGPQMGPWGMMPPMGPGPMMGPMMPPVGPMAPALGYGPTAEDLRQYHLAMLRARAQMLERELEFVRGQIEYLESAEE